MEQLIQGGGKYLPQFILDTSEFIGVVFRNFILLKSIPFQISGKVEFYLQGFHVIHGAIMPGDIPAEPRIVTDGAKALPAEGPLETARKQLGTGSPVDIAEADINLGPFMITVQVDEIGTAEISHCLFKDTLQAAMIGKIILPDPVFNDSPVRLPVIKARPETVTPANNRLPLGAEKGRGQSPVQIDHVPAVSGLNNGQAKLREETVEPFKVPVHGRQNRGRFLAELPENPARNVSGAVGQAGDDREPGTRRYQEVVQLHFTFS
jgi:hypothetical protein